MVKKTKNLTRIAKRWEEDNCEHAINNLNITTPSLLPHTVINLNISTPSLLTHTIFINFLTLLSPLPQVRGGIHILFSLFFYKNKAGLGGSVGCASDW